MQIEYFVIGLFALGNIAAYRAMRKAADERDEAKARAEKAVAAAKEFEDNADRMRQIAEDAYQRDEARREAMSFLNKGVRLLREDHPDLAKSYFSLSGRKARSYSLNKQKKKGARPLEDADDGTEN